MQIARSLSTARLEFSARNQCEASRSIFPGGKGRCHDVSLMSDGIPVAKQNLQMWTD